ncbi:MAG: ATP-binding cassette domain-containing protein [Phycisphaerales bacterium]
MPENHADQPRPPLLTVEDLTVTFGGRRRPFKAVDGVSLQIAEGETFGLVGESGSGKTTVGRAILRLIPATGRATFAGTDLFAASSTALKKLRRSMQIVFQDPSGSLDPRMRIRDIVAEPIRVHGLAKGRDIERRVIELLDRCGMPAAAANRYPHEFSGGQKQRIGIARALAVEPRFIVCDEPTSALDVSIQSQIINLLRQLQRDLGLSYLFISHDMAVIRHMCDRIGVMYQGRIVETGPRDLVLYDPKDSYTRRLLAAVPRTEAATA